MQVDVKVGYCYAPNRLGYALRDEREIALRHALYHDVLHGRPQHLDPGGNGRR